MNCAVLTHCVEAALVTCQHGIVRFANTSAGQLLGAAAGQLVDRPLSSVVRQGPDRGLDLALLARAVREGGVAAQDGLAMRLDGKQVPVSFSISPLAGGDPANLGTLVMLREAGDRHAAALALAQREGRLRALVEASPIGVFAADMLAACTYTNTRWREIFGLSADQGLGTAWLRTLHPDDVEQFAEEWQRCGTQGGELDLSLRVQTPGGTVRLVRCRARPLPTTGEVATGFVGSVEDVTEREALLARLRSSQQRERRLYKMTPTMLFSADGQGRLQTVSELWLDRMGWARNEVIGRPAFDFFSDDSAERLRLMLLGPESVKPGDRSLLQARTRHAEILDVECGLMLEAETADAPFRAVVVLEDVTDRLRAKAALEAERQRLGHIIDATAVGTWEWNVQTGETRFNAKWAQIIGRELEELLPTSIQTWTDCVHPDDLAASNEALTRHFEGRSPYYECEARVRHRDGHWLWVLDRGKLMSRTADGRPEWMYGTHQDISNRKRQEEELNRNRALIDSTGRMAAVGGWELDLHDHTLRWSSEVMRIHGVPPDHQPSVEEAINFYAPEARDRLRHLIGRTIEHGESWDEEFPIIRATGERIWTRVVCEPGHDGGQIVRIAGAIQDISAQVQAREHLQEARERLELATSSGRIGVWDLDLVSHHLVWNDCMWQLYGLKPEPDGGSASRWKDALHPDDRDSIQAEFEHAVRMATEYAFDFRVQHPSGETRYIAAKFRVMRDARGQARRVTGVNWDVTEARRLQCQLTEQAELMRVTLSSIVDAVISTDLQGQIVWMNSAAERMLRVPTQHALGKRLNQLVEVVDAETRTRHASFVAGCLSTGRAQRTEHPILLLRPDGAEVSIDKVASPMRNAQGALTGAVLVLHDVTEQRRLLREMSYRASHDDLTGLINRGSFAERLDQAIQQANGGGVAHALLYIDLDQFKIVNDTSGHAVGDRLLQQVAKLLSHTMRQSDVLARLGGDEFGVLLEHCSVAQSMRVAQGICDELDAFRFQHEGRRIRLGASVGLVAIDGRLSDVSAVMQAADSACYAAKEGGRNRVHAWLDNDRDLKVRTGDLQWAARIEQALDDDRFVLFHQRIEPINRASKGLRAEILVRLAEPDGHLAPPGAFLPAAERFHLASRVDRWVLRKTIAWLHSLDNLDLVDSLSVNFSGQSIGDRAFHLQTVEELSRVAPALLAKLCIEVTETAAVTNLTDAAAFIESLRALGLRIALDDFGAGASSFGYLKSLPVDYLKIDGQFVKNVVEDALDAETVRCFVKVAKVVGVRTVAEFVDRAEVLTQLAEMGVDYAQGFLLHKPAPLEEALGTSTPAALGR